MSEFKCRACGRSVRYEIRTVERDSQIITGNRQIDPPKYTERIFDPEYPQCGCGAVYRMKDIHHPFAEPQ